MPDNSITPYTFMDPSAMRGPVTGFEGFPFHDTGFGQMMYSQISSFAQSQGYQPIGLSQQNIMDQQRNQRFLEQHNEIMARAMQADSANYLRTMRGFARLNDMEWGQKQEQAFKQGLEKMLPHAGTMAAIGLPTLSWLGQSGMNLAPMMAEMSLGSRYQWDAATGQFGMGRESMMSMLNVMQKNVQNDNAAAEFRGFKGQDIGQLSQFLLSRGMMPGGGFNTIREGLTDPDGWGDSPVGRALERMGVGPGGKRTVADLLPSEQRELMRDTDVMDALRADPAASERMRNFQSQRVLDAVKSWTNAASAVGELFGKPGAPMKELMANLEEFVGPDAMVQMDPGKIADMVRQTSQLAKITGITPQAVGAMQGTAARIASQFGMQGFQRMDLVNAGLAHAAAISGQFGPGTTVWGGQTRDQAVQSYMVGRAAATQSEAANRINTFLRVADTMGFQTEEAQTLLQQMKTKTFTGDFNEELLYKTLRAEGLSDAQINDRLGQHFENSRYGVKYDTASILMTTGGSHYREIRNRAADEGRLAVARDLGLDYKRDFDKISGISRGIMDEFTQMSATDYANQETRNAVVAKVLRRQLGEEEFAARFGDTPEEQLRNVAGFADAWRGRIETEMRRDPNSFRGIRTIGDLRRETTAGQRQAQIEAQATAQGVVSAGLEPLGRQGFFSRLADAVAEGKPGGWTEALASTLGTTKEDTRKRIMESLTQFLEKPMTELADLRTKAENEKDPAKRAEYMKAIKAKEGELRAAALKVKQDLGQAGIDEITLSEEAKEIEDEKKKKAEEERKKAAKETDKAKDKDKTPDSDKATKEEGEVTVNWPEEMAVALTSGTLKLEGLDKVTIKAAGSAGARGSGAKA